MTRINAAAAPLALMAVLFCGCAPRVDRVVASPHKTFSHCVIDARWDDDVQQLRAALGPYYQLTTAPEARAGGFANQTTVCTMSGMPGLWGSEVVINFDSLEPQQRLSHISVHHGLLYLGRGHCMHDAVELLDVEAREFSDKMHPKDML